MSQRHYGEGSRIAAVLLVYLQSVFSRVPVDARSWQKFGDFMLVSLLVGVVFRLVPASAVGWSGAAGLRTQSNRSIMVVLSLYCPC